MKERPTTMQNFSSQFPLHPAKALSAEEARLWRLQQVRRIGEIVTDSPMLEAPLTAWLMANETIPYILFTEWFIRCRVKWDDRKIGAHIRAIITAGKQAYENVPGC